MHSVKVKARFRVMTYDWLTVEREVESWDPAGVDVLGSPESNILEGMADEALLDVDLLDFEIEDTEVLSVEPA